MARRKGRECNGKGLARKGRPQCVRPAGQRLGCVQPFRARPVGEAELTRFIQTDYQAERLSYRIDEQAIERAYTGIS